MPEPPSAVRRRSSLSGSPYEEVFGFTRGVRVGDVVYVAGTGPVWPDGACDPDPAVQARRCWEIAATALRDLGADVGHVVRTRVYVTDALRSPTRSGAYTARCSAPSDLPRRWWSWRAWSISAGTSRSRWRRW